MKPKLMPRYWSMMSWVSELNVREVWGVVGKVKLIDQIYGLRNQCCRKSDEYVPLFPTNPEPTTRNSSRLHVLFHCPCIIPCYTPTEELTLREDRFKALVRRHWLYRDSLGAGSGRKKLDFSGILATPNTVLGPPQDISPV